jgi:hypothetical protein
MFHLKFPKCILDGTLKNIPLREEKKWRDIYYAYSLRVGMDLMPIPQQWVGPYR